MNERIARKTYYIYCRRGDGSRCLSFVLPSSLFFPYILENEELLREQ